MRESIKEFIDRVVDNEYISIRVEANDMLPIIGNKSEILDRVDGLYVIDADFSKMNLITIRATYHTC